MQRAGYEFVAAFALPEIVWEDFYALQDVKITEFMAKYDGDHSAKQQLVDAERYEKSLWDKYKKFYGYVFYMGRKM